MIYWLDAVDTNEREIVKQIEVASCPLFGPIC